MARTLRSALLAGDCKCYRSLRSLSESIHCIRVYDLYLTQFVETYVILAHSACGGGVGSFLTPFPQANSVGRLQANIFKLQMGEPESFVFSHIAEVSAPNSVEMTRTGVLHLFFAFVRIFKNDTCSANMCC